jgi:hypothetical protein
MIIKILNMHKGNVRLCCNMLVVEALRQNN